jgi:hypothetical protein
MAGPGCPEWGFFGPALFLYARWAHAVSYTKRYNSLRSGGNTTDIVLTLVKW